jgi:hypothetical protein
MSASRLVASATRHYCSLIPSAQQLIVHNNAQSRILRNMATRTQTSVQHPIQALQVSLQIDDISTST